MDADHELEMNISHREVRVLLFYESRISHRATEAVNNIFSSMREDVLGNGNLELNDLPRFGRS